MNNKPNSVTYILMIGNRMRYKKDFSDLVIDVKQTFRASKISFVCVKHIVSKNHTLILSVLCDSEGIPVQYHADRMNLFHRALTPQLNEEEKKKLPAPAKGVDKKWNEVPAKIVNKLQGVFEEAIQEIFEIA